MNTPLCACIFQSPALAGRAQRPCPLPWRGGIPAPSDVAPMLPANGPILKSPAPAANDGALPQAHCWGWDARRRSKPRSTPVAGPSSAPSHVTCTTGRFRRQGGLRAPRAIRHAGDRQCKPERARQTSADGVHLDTGSSCDPPAGPHWNGSEPLPTTVPNWRRRRALRLDYALLGPVGDCQPSRTAGHRLAGRLRDTGLRAADTGAGAGRPVTRRDADARRHGAHGIAAIRGMWEPGLNNFALSA